MTVFHFQIFQSDSAIYKKKLKTLDSEDVYALHGTCLETLIACIGLTLHLQLQVTMPFKEKLHLKSKY